MEESLAMIRIPSFTLAKLPSDIIRDIVRMEEDSMESMRLISHSWNSVVIEHKKDPRYLLSLERLHIHNDYDHSARVLAPQPVHNFGSPFPPAPSALRYVQPPRDARVEVHALVPEQCAKKIGLGVWLSVTKRYPGAIEVTCMPQKFASASMTPGKAVYVCRALTLSLLMLICAAIAFLAFNKSILAFITGAMLPLILVGTCYGCSRCCDNKDHSDEFRSARFRRFLSLFSQVNTLVLDNIGYPDYDIFDTVTATLGEIKIARLEVKDEECDGFMLKRILTLTQTHSIRQVSLVAHRFEAEKLGKFLLQMTKMGATVNISEAVAHFSRSPNYQIGVYFQKPVEFWDEMVSYLAKDAVTLQISTNQDANFDKYQCSAWVRASLSCGSNDIERGDEDARHQRGYYRQKWMNGR